MKKLAIIFAATLLVSCSGAAFDQFPGSVSFSWPSGQSVALDVGDSALFYTWNDPSWSAGTESGFVWDAPTSGGKLFLSTGTSSVTVDASSVPIVVVSGTATAGSSAITSPNPFPAGLTTSDVVVSSAFPTGTTFVSTSGSGPYTMTLSNTASTSGTVALELSTNWLGFSANPSFTVTSGQGQSYAITQ